MPYRLQKSPGRNMYWVVTKKTGRKHSRSPLPLQRAKAQMRALYAVESGYTLRNRSRSRSRSRSRKSRRRRSKRSMRR